MIKDSKWKTAIHRRTQQQNNHHHHHTPHERLHNFYHSHHHHPRYRYHHTHHHHHPNHHQQQQQQQQQHHNEKLHRRQLTHHKVAHHFLFGDEESSGDVGELPQQPHNHHHHHLRLQNNSQYPLHLQKPDRQRGEELQPDLAGGEEEEEEGRQLNVPQESLALQIQLDAAVVEDAVFLSRSYPQCSPEAATQERGLPRRENCLLPPVRNLRSRLTTSLCLATAVGPGDVLPLCAHTPEDTTDAQTDPCQYGIDNGEIIFISNGSGGYTEIRNSNNTSNNNNCHICADDNNNSDSEAVSTPTYRGSPAPREEMPLPLQAALPDGTHVSIEEATEPQLSEMYALIQQAASLGEGYGVDEYPREEDFREEIRGGRSFVVTAAEDEEEEEEEEIGTRGRSSHQRGGRRKLLAAFSLADSKYYRGTDFKVADPIIIVAREERRKGIGEFVFRQTVNICRRLGYAGIYTDTFCNNTAMIRIIERTPGFKLVGFLPLGGKMPDGSFVAANIYFKDLRAGLDCSNSAFRP